MVALVVGGLVFLYHVPINEFKWLLLLIKFDGCEFKYHAYSRMIAVDSILNYFAVGDSLGSEVGIDEIVQHVRAPLVVELTPGNVG